MTLHIQQNIQIFMKFLGENLSGNSSEIEFCKIDIGTVSWSYTKLHTRVTLLRNLPQEPIQHKFTTPNSKARFSS
jgi:hypothetical protein